MTALKTSTALKPAMVAFETPANFNHPPHPGTDIRPAPGSPDEGLYRRPVQQLQLDADEGQRSPTWCARIAGRRRGAAEGINAGGVFTYVVSGKVIPERTNFHWPPVRARPLGQRNTNIYFCVLMSQIIMHVIADSAINTADLRNFCYAFAGNIINVAGFSG